MPGRHVVVTDFDGGVGILVDLNAKKYYHLTRPRCWFGEVWSMANLSPRLLLI